jgi:hypothetical protein
MYYAHIADWSLCSKEYKIFVTVSSNFVPMFHGEAGSAFRGKIGSWQGHVKQMNYVTTNTFIILLITPGPKGPPIQLYQS